MDAIDEIKQLYYQATAKSIQEDFARAIDLLKAMPDEATRERAAVYMEGLAEMRNEWSGRGDGGGGHARGGGSGSRRPHRGGGSGQSGTGNSGTGRSGRESGGAATGKPATPGTPPGPGDGPGPHRSRR
jgi:hypothetical protein